MKPKEEREELALMNLDQLYQALTETRESQFQNRMRLASHSLESIEPLRKGRKRIARILTYIRQRQLAGDGS